MAQRKALISLLSTKLSAIEAQKDVLHGVVDAYVSNVTAEAVTAVESDEQDMQKLKELNTQLEQVPVFLIGLIGDVEGSAERTPGAEQLKLVSAASSTLSRHFSDKSMQGISYSDGSEISKLFQRMDTLEIAMKGCCSDVRQCSEQNAESAQDFKEKLQNMERTYEAFMNETKEAAKRESSKLDKMKDSVGKLEVSNTELKEKLSEEVEQLNVGLANTEEKLHEMVLENIDSMKEDVSKVNNLEKKLKKLETGKERDASRLGSLVGEVDALKSQLSKQQQQQSSKTKNLEQQMKSFKCQIGSLQNLKDDLCQVKLTVGGFTSELDTFARKDDLDNVVKTVETFKTSLDDISTRVGASETWVKSSVSHREKELNKRHEMEDRLSVLEANRSKDIEHYTKELEEVQSLFKQVCCMVDSKVEPLRRLQKTLNDYHKRVEAREILSQRVDKVTDQINDISAQVSTLNKQQRHPPVTFSAKYAPNTRLGPKYSTLSGFKNVLLNEGNSYDPVTGVFTAPQDGLYATSVKLAQVSQGHIRVGIAHRQRDFSVGFMVGEASTSADKRSDCSTMAVDLKAGDRLYLYVVDASDDIMLGKYSTFSCFLVG